MNITRADEGKLIRFECPECGETWFIVLGTDQKPTGKMSVDDYHLGMMYYAAGTKGDRELADLIVQATSTRDR